MVHRVRQQVNKRFGPTTLAIVALSFLLVALAVTSDLNWTSASAAKDPGTPVQLSPGSAAIPNSFADLTKTLGPTVVNIKVTKIEKVRAFQWPEGPDGPFGEFFKRFFKEMPQFPEKFHRQGAGSGVIISRDGYVVTNNHVVEGAKEVTVTLADKREYSARVVGRDPKTDLAVLKIEADESFPVATLGDSDQLKVGDWVLAIGNPFGLSNTVTAGIVSAKGRSIGAGPYDDFIQTDASINPGNSGGPLFNLRGEVVGINTAINPAGQGIGFAIPVNMAKPLIPQLVATGEVTRGYLGVSIQSITAELAKALKLNDRKGALVGDVASGSPAEKAGIRRGDVIVAFDKDAVASARNLPAMVAKTPVGQEVTVTILRDGVEHQIPITVGKFPSEPAKGDESNEPAQGRWGLQLQDVTPQMAKELGLKADHGAVITGVQRGSPADRGGIRRGDVILEVNRQPVSSVKEVMGLIDTSKDEEALLLLVKRGRGSFFVALERET
ncbi:MAG: DegQ family serine endoprotease [Candidatus Methylomirabilales bacterium]